jgi:hypothetical protein
MVFRMGIIFKEDLTKDNLRRLPAVHALMQHPLLKRLVHSQALHGAREALVDARRRISVGESLDVILSGIIEKAAELALGSNTEDLSRHQLIANAIVLTDPWDGLTEELRRISATGILALPRQQLGEMEGKRIEDFVIAAGWKALPVGAINKSRLSDMENALQQGATALAWLETQGYTLKGFVTVPTIEQMGTLALKAMVPFLLFKLE